MVEAAEDELQTHHISFWVSSPGMQPSTLDVGLMFPLTAVKIREIIDEALQGLGTEWLHDPVAVSPQLHEDYASYILVPNWLWSSVKRVVMVDAARFGLGTYPRYVDTLITRRLVCEWVGVEDHETADVFIGGSLAPLEPAERYQAYNGCLIRVLRRGEEVSWSSDVEERFDDPARWRPETDHPLPAAGRFIQFQGRLHAHSHGMRRGDQRTPQAIAAEIFNSALDTFWLRAPTERPFKLYDRGRRIYSVIAVLENDRFVQADTSIVFIDLRPLGLWLQWCVAPAGRFHPGTYIQGLHLQVVPGFSIVAQGGRKLGHGLLAVEDGELLLAVLRPTASLAAATATARTTTQAQTMAMPRTATLATGAHRAGHHPACAAPTGSML